MLTVEEAANQYHVAKTTICNAIYSEKLPATKRGGILFIDRVDITQWRANTKMGRPSGSKKKADGAADTSGETQH